MSCKVTCLNALHRYFGTPFLKMEKIIDKIYLIFNATNINVPVCSCYLYTTKSVKVVGCDMGAHHPVHNYVVSLESF